MRRGALCLAAAAFCLGFTPVHAQQPADGPAIVARFQQALGGLEAFRAINSLHGTGELLIPSAGIGGSVEVWQARPNRSVMHVAVEGFGEVRTGYTGTAGWAVSTTEGARLLTGAEALQAADDAHFDSLLRTTDVVDSLVFVERTTLAGDECDKVRVVWRTGRVTADCFAVDTGLLIGSVREHTAAPGVEATVLYEEYRQFGAIRVPTRVTTRVGGIDQVITLRDVDFDQVTDDVFQPPPAVRALIRS